jgi:hypothetical protein
METTAAPKPWEQQPGEKDRDFEAFRLFLSGCTKQAVANEDGRTRPRIHAIAKRWNWERRAAAYRFEAAPPPQDLLPPQDTATVLIENVLSDAQVSHLQKISDYQARAERLGNAQISIAGQLLQIVQQRITDHRLQKTRQLNVEPLIRAATTAATTGHKLMGDALGIEELFLTMQQHLEQNDPLRLPPAPATTT